MSALIKTPLLEPMSEHQSDRGASRDASNPVAFIWKPTRFKNKVLLADIALLGQEHRDMADEELRVHVVRAVIGVGVDDQLRIRHVLLHDERVHRGHDHIVTAVPDEGWLLD